MFCDFKKYYLCNFKIIIKLIKFKLIVSSLIQQLNFLNLLIKKLLIICFSDHYLTIFELIKFLFYSIGLNTLKDIQ